MNFQVPFSCVFERSVVGGVYPAQTCVVPRHEPTAHWSCAVQGLLSSQATVLFEWAQEPPLQVSVVQTLPSSHPVESMQSVFPLTSTSHMLNQFRPLLFAPVMVILVSSPSVGGKDTSQNPAFSDVLPAHT